MATYFCSTASEIFPYVVAVQVAMTLRTSSNGNDLSAITVTSRVEVSSAPLAQHHRTVEHAPQRLDQRLARRYHFGNVGDQLALHEHVVLA